MKRHRGGTYLVLSRQVNCSEWCPEFEQFAAFIEPARKRRVLIVVLMQFIGNRFGVDGRMTAGKINNRSRWRFCG